jgi:hypothetical protein
VTGIAGSTAIAGIDGAEMWGAVCAAAGKDSAAAIVENRNSRVVFMIVSL